VKPFSILYFPGWEHMERPLLDEGGQPAQPRDEVGNHKDGSALLWRDMPPFSNHDNVFATWLPCLPPLYFLDLVQDRFRYDA